GGGCLGRRCSRSFSRGSRGGFLRRRGFGCRRSCAFFRRGTLLRQPVADRQDNGDDDDGDDRFRGIGHGFPLTRVPRPVVSGAGCNRTPRPGPRCALGESAGTRSNVKDESPFRTIVKREISASLTLLFWKKEAICRKY